MIAPPTLRSAGSQAKVKLTWIEHWQDVSNEIGMLFGIHHAGIKARIVATPVLSARALALSPPASSQRPPELSLTQS